MAYCTEADVKVEFKNISWDTPGGIAATTITEWCVQESAVIDTLLSTVYVVPITGPNSLNTLKKIAIMMVSSRVKKTLQVKEINPANQDQVIDEYKQALELLKAIVDGQLLGDAILIIVSLESLKVFVNSETHECVFDKDKVQW